MGNNLKAKSSVAVIAVSFSFVLALSFVSFYLFSFTLAFSFVLSFVGSQMSIGAVPPPKLLLTADEFCARSLLKAIVVL